MVEGERRWSYFVTTNSLRAARGHPPYLQPYLLGDSYKLYHSLRHANLTDEQVHRTVISALRAMVARHRLDQETVHHAVRDNIAARLKPPVVRRLAVRTPANDAGAVRID